MHTLELLVRINSCAHTNIAWQKLRFTFAAVVLPLPFLLRNTNIFSIFSLSRLLPFLLLFPAWESLPLHKNPTRSLNIKNKFTSTVCTAPLHYDGSFVAYFDFLWSKNLVGFFPFASYPSMVVYINVKSHNSSHPCLLGWELLAESYGCVMCVHSATCILLRQN